MGLGPLFAIPTLIWGSTWFAIKFQLGAVAPQVSVAYRFALAAAILAAWCAATGRPLALPRRAHAWMALQGVTMFGLNYVASTRPRSGSRPGSSPWCSRRSCS